MNRRPTTRTHPFTDAARGPRLQKVLADLGAGSRRACEALIEAGDVSVNGTIVSSLPAWVDPARDKVSVRGKRLRAIDKLVHVLLFKPRGVVCTNDDPEGRVRAIDLVRHPSRARLYPVGRLDCESSGLLLLTNDGDLANRLAHPRYGVHKTYEVTVAGALDDDTVRKLESGVFLSDLHTTHGRDAGSRTGWSRVKILDRERDRTRLLVEITEGRNRQVRRMMLDVGHPVKKLRRVAIGPLTLKGLRPSQWRDLRPEEVEALRRSARRGSLAAGAAAKTTHRESGTARAPRKAARTESGARSGARKDSAAGRKDSGDTRKGSGTARKGSGTARKGSGTTRKGSGTARKTTRRTGRA